MKCSKSTGIYNLQPADCIVVPGVIQKFILVSYFKEDGTVNGIDLNSPFNETVIDALLAQANKSLRWYPTDEVKNFVSERADPNTEAIDGVNYITSDGVRTMSCDFLNSPAELVKKINSNNNQDIGVFLVDKANGLTGVVTRDGFLDPVKLERNSFGKMVMATEASIFKVMYSSTWSRLISDGDIRTLLFDDHLTNLLAKRGLVDVKNRNITVPSATTAKASIYIPNGHATGIEFAGLVLGDFVLTNKTTLAAVAISAVVENPDGTYEFTFLAQTTADLGEITITKAGFEFEPINFTFA